MVLQSSITTAEEFFVRVGLYAPTFLPDQDELIADIEYFTRAIDTFCIHCSEDRTYLSSDSRPWYTDNRSRYEYSKLEYTSYKNLINEGAETNFPPTSIWCSWYDHQRQPRVIHRTFNCARDSSHRFDVSILASDYMLTKFGQYPSMADLKKSEYKGFKKVISSEWLKELTKAEGLFAHGIGIGSFVYLRRIFEFLIEEAHQRAQLSYGWKEDAYRDRHIDEKIEKLRDFLPQFLVRHRSIYGILSKGLHQLDEAECLEMYPTLRNGIELILVQKAEQEARRLHHDKAERELEQLKERLAIEEKQADDDIPF